MTRWVRRLRGAIGMGVIWAAGWALVGLLIGVTSRLLPFLPWDEFFRIFDAPLPALAVPGFFAGVFFALVLGVAGRRRGFAELSLLRVAAWGALGGLMLSLLPAALVAAGLATISGSGSGLWHTTAIISVPLMLLSAASASGSLVLARKAASRELPESSGRPARLGPS